MIEDVLIVFFNLVIFARMITLRDPSSKGIAKLAGGCVLFFAAYGIAVYGFHFPMMLSSLLAVSLPSLVWFWLLSAFATAGFSWRLRWRIPCR